MSFMNVIDSGRVFLDTNIIVYAHDLDEPRKQTIAKNILSCTLRKRRGVISAQVMGETFVSLIKKIGIEPADATDEICKLTRFRVIDLSKALVMRGLEIKASFGLSYWDALIIAAAERASCPVVFSEDLSDGQQYGIVTVVNPFNALNR